MKKIKIFLAFIVMVLLVVGCGSKVTKADYTETDAETALNKGDDLEGKTVKIKVTALVPDSAFGYNIQTGEHLNFVSPENPKVKEGEELIVKITKVTSTMGSFIITYEKV
ncbi:hypothetical protein [Enterococcus wangshanyuanii]|uniref:Uncharacterized protein n=1 Tax=Enterococcus wangshanyuanii TaxID=2005703 RepID=A0ABQ1PYC1_9ENTE|nr:hypothetical protein [Enterococcus wangshanyuanii]GGD06098.1 hypothetical protein GCM10011573_39390 [Enterococcus wangshanyuanii]